MLPTFCGSQLDRHAQHLHIVEHNLFRLYFLGPRNTCRNQSHALFLKSMSTMCETLPLDVHQIARNGRAKRMKRHQEIGAFTGLVVCDGPEAGTRSASEDGRGVGQESGRANWGENHEAVQTIS